MCIALLGATEAAGSFCCRSPLPSPPGAGVVASLEQSTIVTSMPPSWRTYGWSEISTSASAGIPKVSAASVHDTAARTHLLTFDPPSVSMIRADADRSPRPLAHTPAADGLKPDTVMRQTC